MAVQRAKSAVGALSPDDAGASNLAYYEIPVFAVPEYLPERPRREWWKRL